MQLQAAVNRAHDAAATLEMYGDVVDVHCADIAEQVDEYHSDDPDAAAVHKDALEARCIYVAEKYVALELAIVRLKSAISAAKADPSVDRAAELLQLLRDVDAAERAFIAAVQELTGAGQ